MLNAPCSQKLLPLTVTKLCFSAPGKPLINQLSFSIKETGISALMGPNGAGKSLTLRLLHGLLPPTSGKISWGEASWSETSWGETSGQGAIAQQAMVFQKPVLLRRSVLDNLRYVEALAPKGLADGAIEAALVQAKLTDKATVPARRLSGGEQQRLVMARALMLNPAVLLLDEPTSSLDPRATRDVEEIIQAAKARGVKIVLVTHDVGQAKRLADEILFIHQGRLCEQGPARKMIEAPTSEPARQYFAGEIVGS